jgi:hypothetical protein
MKHVFARLPMLVAVLAVLAMVAHGPIEQFADYHRFADRATWLGIPNGADVLSNLGFAVVGLWGAWRLYPRRCHPATSAGWPGYALFLAGLLLTAAGSGFYHLAPDDFRLVWDRLPISLTCAGLLAAVRAEARRDGHVVRDTVLLALFGVGGVAWWYGTLLAGQGDLRPYLLLQGLVVVLVPLWQAQGRAATADRLWFGAALGLYLLARVAELNDQAWLAATGWISGHTLKHLLATAAAAVLIVRLVRRAASPA